MGVQVMPRLEKLGLSLRENVKVTLEYFPGYCPIGICQAESLFLTGDGLKLLVSMAVENVTFLAVGMLHLREGSRPFCGVNLLVLAATPAAGYRFAG